MTRITRELADEYEARLRVEGFIGSGSIWAHTQDVRRDP